MTKEEDKLRQAGARIEQEHPLVTMLVSYHFHATWDYGEQNYTADFVSRWLHDSPSALARDYVQTNIREGVVCVMDISRTLAIAFCRPDAGD